MNKQMDYIDVSKEYAKCPKCGEHCKRHSFGKREIIDLHGSFKFKISKHYCVGCNKYFSIQLDFAQKSYKYSNKVVNKIVELCDKLDPLLIRKTMINDYGIEIARSTIDEWIIKSHKISRSSVKSKRPNKIITKQERLKVLKSRHFLCNV